MLHKIKEIRTKENIMKEENYKIRKIWKMERRVKKIMDVVDVVRDLDVLFVHFKDLLFFTRIYFNNLDVL